jgi:superfamily II DNA or RNA helicase
MEFARLERPLTDGARRYETLKLALKEPIAPRPHQTEALAAWIASQKRGTVCLPTGAGKTILAVLAILAAQRSTLVVVPTIDLMQQWDQVLTKFFGVKVGLVGGGSHDVQALTVATYDSAYLHIERLGDRFGLLIADEAHHSAASQYQIILRGTIAPFRLGLSATIERSDGKEAVIYESASVARSKGTRPSRPPSPARRGLRRTDLSSASFRRPRLCGRRCSARNHDFWRCPLASTGSANFARP